MKLKPKYLPFIGLVTGLMAYGCRYWLFTTGVDDRGLLRTGHPGNFLTYILIGVALAAVFLCSRPAPKTATWNRVFRPDLLSLVGSCLAAMGLSFTALAERGEGFFPVLLTCLGVAAALAIGLSSLFRYEKKAPRMAFHTVVTLYMMLHILSQYRGWNFEPQLQQYLPQLLASVFLMLSAYHRAALDGGEGNYRSYLFFNYGAVFFCLLAVHSATPVFYLSMAIWTATANCDPLSPAPMELPEEVLSCIRALEEKGHSAYAVGGCVRDWLLELTPHDYDLCTSATPEEICEIFGDYELVRAGEKHGTIGVVIDGTVYEITTYRTEGGYSDSRHPDWVKFEDHIEADLSRRDFTVNAMAYSPKRGYADPFGGQQDLENSILRAVGDPETRFREDALRILRGVRFASRFTLEPEEKTLKAMVSCRELMENLAAERVLAELVSMLPDVSAADLCRYAPILTQVIPELAPCVGFDQQNRHHIHDIFTHTAHVVEAAPKDVTLRLAALLHDIGKPRCFTLDEDGEGHFYNHAAVSADMADEILTRLKAPNQLRQQVVLLIREHMTLLEPERTFLRRRVGKFGMETVRQMVALQQADRIGTGTDLDSLPCFEEMENILDQLEAEASCLQLKDLAVDGNDLMALGIAPGPQLGQYLNRLFEMVLEESVPNEKEALLEQAKILMQE